MRSGRSRAKTSSVSTTSFEVDESIGDIHSTSLFDLRNVGKYYVSHKPDAFQRFRLFCRQLNESKIVVNSLMLVILMNTICMAVEHHKQPENMTIALEYMNLFFIWAFSLEMLTKLLGMGPRLYFNYGFNCFDAFVVLISFIELLVGAENSGSFMVFRSLRLLRIFRLVRPMRYQIAVMLKTTSSVMTFFGLLFLFMFTFAVLGMNIFGGRFVFKDFYGNSVKSRSNFDSFFWSMITVFQILTQEDWNLVMYDGMRSNGKFATIYFIFLMTIGYYVLLNLLVAILVEGFTTPLEKKRMIQEITNFLASKKKMETLKRTISLPDIKKAKPESIHKRESFSLFARDLNISSNLINRLGMRRKTLAIFNPDDGRSSTELNSRQYAKTSIASTCSTTPTTRRRSPKGEPILLSARSSDCHGLPLYSFTNYSPKKRLSIESDHLNVYKEYDIGDEVDSLFPKKIPFTIRRQNWSLYLFPEKSRFRQTMKRIKDSKYFDHLILCLILYSCILLALETPKLRQNSLVVSISFLLICFLLIHSILGYLFTFQLAQVIETSSFVLTWVFIVEMMIKVIADGLFIDDKSYLRNGWNVLDGFLIAVSLIDVIVQFSFSSMNKKSPELFKGLRVLRASRALRPLRVIRKAPGLKLVVQTLIYSLKPIGNTVLIAIIFFAVFGILGVQLFKGAFYFCHGVEHGLVQNKSECLKNSNGDWINYQYNFDNLFEALMSLFVVSTKDGWVDLMRRGVDARGVDLEPKINYAPWRVLYFVLFILIGGFLVLNMLVGVVVENFQKCQELQEKENKTRAILQTWRKKATKKKFWEEYGAHRKTLYKLCTHVYWDMWIGIVIFINVVIMASEHYNMSEGFKMFLEMSNIGFTLVYVFEATMLLIALGPRRYFKDKWHCFDMVIVVVSVLGIFLEELKMNDIKINATAIKAMRMLRVVRVLKLLKVAKGLRFLLDRVGDTIPQVTNLGLLFSLLFFIYSCLGMQLFGTLECNSKYPCAGLGRHANFRSLGSSMLTLFRIATGDNWSGILKDTLRPNCDGSINCRSNCCTSRYVAPFFFVSFVLFAQFVLVNIVIAVLMKHLQFPDKKKKRQRRRRTLNLNKQSIKGFVSKAKLGSKLVRQSSKNSSSNRSRRRWSSTRKRWSKYSDDSKSSISSTNHKHVSSIEQPTKIEQQNEHKLKNFQEMHLLSPSFAQTIVHSQPNLKEYPSYASSSQISTPNSLQSQFLKQSVNASKSMPSYYSKSFSNLQTINQHRSNLQTANQHHSNISLNIHSSYKDIKSCSNETLFWPTQNLISNKEIVKRLPIFQIGQMSEDEAESLEVSQCRDEVFKSKGTRERRLSVSSPDISKLIHLASLTEKLESTSKIRSHNNLQVPRR